MMHSGAQECLSPYETLQAGALQLTLDERNELALKVRAGDKQATERLVFAYHRLIRKFANHYSWQPQLVGDNTADDLYQFGVMGLLEAVNRWQPKRASFGTVAYLYILKSIRTRAMDTGRTIFVGAGSLWRVSAMHTRMRREGDGADLAAGLRRIQMAPATYQIVSNSTPASLDEPLNRTSEGGSHDRSWKTSLEDMLPDPKANFSDQLIERLTVEAALNRLSDSDRNVLVMRFWLDMQYDEIGRELGGVTRQRVEQLVKRALGNIRWQFEERPIQ